MKAGDLASSRPLHARRRSYSNVEGNNLSTIPCPDAVGHHGTLNFYERKLDFNGETLNWMTVHPCGNKPQARYYHASTVVGRKMLVVGGDSDLGILNDVQQLHLGKLTWSELVAGDRNKLEVQKLPACRGHSLVAWGKSVLLVGGQREPPDAKLAVWMFNLENQCWSKVETKGEVPVSRTGQSVCRAGSVLLLFGGEGAKGQKLNDLYMLDLNSLMWLPLQATGSVPCPRSKHVAAMHGNQFLLVFGGASKSRALNDLYALDFETMEWSQIKTPGVSPGPRAECAGVLVGDKWYIAGGEFHGTRCLETLLLDVSTMTWSTLAISMSDSSLTSQGFSMVHVQRKERSFLVAFGGKRTGFSNEVQILHIGQVSHGSSTVSTCDTMKVDLPLSKLVEDAEYCVPSPHSSLHLSESSMEAANDRETIIRNQQKPKGHLTLEADAAVKLNCAEELQSLISQSSLIKSMSIGRRLEPKYSLKHGRNMLNELFNLYADDKHWETDTDRLESPFVSQVKVISSPSPNSERVQVDDFEKTMPVSELKRCHEQKLGIVLRNNAVLEGKLAAALKDKQEAEKNLSAVIKARQKAEDRMAAALKDLGEMKEIAMVAQRAQEKSERLSNMVLAENAHMQHDLAFLDAALEEMEKELHTTREVLAGERSRAFQLQVEVFELRQIIQNVETSQATKANESIHGVFRTDTNDTECSEKSSCHSK
eukprot:c15789_g2_i1 orf=215-2338(-)